MLIEQVVSRGGTREQGQCLVDGAVERWGGLERAASDDGGSAAEMMEITVGCFYGEAGDLSNCLVESVVDDELASEPDMNEFADAFSDADPRDLAEAALQCQGMTAEAARCTADAMAAERGEDVFERGINWSEDQREVIEATLTCNGLSSTDARCVTDEIATEFGENAFEIEGFDATFDDRFIFEAGLRCGGSGASAANCVADSVEAQLGEDYFSGAQLVPAEEQIVFEATLQCNGLTGDEARCVTDGLVEKFGKETFVAQESSPSQQAQLDALVADCTATAPQTTTTIPTTTTPPDTLPPYLGAEVFDFNSLTVGTCLYREPPRAGLADDSRRVWVTDCAQPHQGELFHVLTLEGGPEAPYPGDAAVDMQSETRCATAFAPYVGVPYDSSRLYFIFLYPDAALWSQGDRLVQCILYGSTPEELLTSSMAGSGQ